MATQRDATAQPRIPLNRERVLRAALDLVDEEGIESLTMRKLGRALGVEAMSLYNHVEGKDDVLNGIVDLVVREIELPSATEDWDTTIRRSAVSAHEALRRHSWAPGQLMSPTRISLARLRYMDSLLRRLREAGFSPDVVYGAYHALDGHIFGFSLWQATHSVATADPELVKKFLRSFPISDYPDLAEHIEQHRTEGPHRDVGAFEFSLDLILDGLRKIYAAAGLAD